MLFSLGAGEPPADPSPHDRQAARRMAATLLGAGGSLRRGAEGTPLAHLVAPTQPPAAPGDVHRRLDALADALVDAECEPSDAECGLPLVYPLFAHFIDHDIAAIDDADARALAAAAAASSSRPEDGPAPERPDHRVGLVNLREGALRLDSLYRVDAGDGPLAEKLEQLMREPGAPARMRIDLAQPSPLGALALPADGGADLLRLGRILSHDPACGVTPTEIFAAPPPLRARLAPGGRIDPRRPVIGEARNAESLPIAQFHLALLRFHNRVVEWAVDTGAATPDRLFSTAKRLVRWHVQWLALNDFLPRVCDGEVLDRIRRAGAPFYADFRRRAERVGAEGLPVPLEYWAAASRWRLSVTRARWDLNRFHGRPEAGGPAPISPRATLDQLVHDAGARLAGPRLPSHLAVDWSRMVADPPSHRDRAARRIDTFVAPSWTEGGAAGAEVFRRLARQALRQGHALGLPSGQDCVAAFNDVYHDMIRPLNEAELTAGHTGEAVGDGLVEATPLWFYLLKEAEVQTGGLRLGQLGSALLAETLVGLAASDHASVWHRRGRAGGPWTPADGARPGGASIDSLRALFAAADLV